MLKKILINGALIEFLNFVNIGVSEVRCLFFVRFGKGMPVRKQNNGLVFIKLGKKK